MRRDRQKRSWISSAEWKRTPKELTGVRLQQKGRWRGEGEVHQFVVKCAPASPAVK